MKSDRHQIQQRRWSATLAALLLAGSAAACESAPEEPTSSSSAPRPAATPKDLEWSVPPTWNIDRTATSGTYRARYTIPPSGNAKHNAELLVSNLGRGAKADVGAELDELLAQFEGPGVKDAKRDKLTVGAFEIEMLEVAATYKYPMTPPIGPKKKQMVHAIKEGWRGIAAGVKTKDRGNWFFRMVGPNDTVEAARSAFHEMIKSLK